MTRRIELLAPAKDASAAIAAIRCGADAVYIGAEHFGAREQAGNTIEAIQQATDFAHQYYAKVYVTLNTLLFDNELPTAEKSMRDGDILRAFKNTIKEITGRTAPYKGCE